MQANNWIIFQQRVEDTLGYDHSWVIYKNGFGAVGGNYWMGNEKVHFLKTSGQYMLRIKMMSITIGWVSAEYNFFYLDVEFQFYKIHLGGYSGDCRGDPMLYTGDDGIFYHNGMNFSASDSDNDMLPTVNCATNRLSGWRFNACAYVNLNGRMGGWDFHFVLNSLSASDVYLAAFRMMIKLIQ